MIIDVWAQATTPRFAAAPWLQTLLKWTGREGDTRGTTVEQTISAMDAAGVDITFLSAWSSPTGDLISNTELQEQIDQAPDRLRGLATVDLTDPMGAVREIRRVVDGKRIVGVRLVPWLWDLPPNDRRYYPVYAAYIETGVPFCTQIGHTGPLKRSETGRMLPYLEDVMLDFPELVVVGGHVGFPWLDELHTMTIKFPNFHVDTSAYALHRLPTAFIDWMKGIGRKRVMFGTNWPMLSPQRCLEGIDALELGDKTRDAFLSGNARRVFNLS
ncbi:amidohydrolase family protein [Hyphomonas atlantica]|uniref:amidohydrolase family protein n=1 Tax=Hyphomonas atlantica TaxID=1280948 RepID=UPI00351600FB